MQYLENIEYMYMYVNYNNNVINVGFLTVYDLSQD